MSDITPNTASSASSSSSSSLTTSPNPGWKPLDPQPHPFGESTPFVTLDPATIGSSYFLLISGVVPRPIAFVSTVSNAGVVNLAPFSYFSAVAHDPPTVSIGICHNRDGSKKDTLVNIEENGEFVVNMISEWMVESANHTCGSFPPEVDEMKLVGLTPLPSDVVKPPRVAESAFQMECRLVGSSVITNDAGVATTSVVLGRVVMFHVLEPLLEDGPRGSITPQVKIDGYRPLGRLGGDTWVKMGDRFDIDRPAR